MIYRATLPFTSQNLILAYFEPQMYKNCIKGSKNLFRYVGHTAPEGVNKGIAFEFSLMNYFKNLMVRLTGGQIVPPKEEQFVVTPVHPGVKTR